MTVEIVKAVNGYAYGMKNMYQLPTTYFGDLIYMNVEKVLHKWEGDV